MNDLYDAMRKAVSEYMNVDSLTPRAQARVKGTHSKFAYNYDTVDSLIEFETELQEIEEELEDSAKTK
jgi:hypothetical protein